MGLICLFKYCARRYKYAVIVSTLSKARSKFMGGIIDYWNVYCYLAFTSPDSVGRAEFITVRIDNYSLSETWHVRTRGELLQV